jgi:nucleoside-diphosphate-sugar epimerase
MRSMRTALVTGGYGFIGSHLVAKLVSGGVHVRVLDNLSSGVRDNLSGFRSDEVEILEGDVRDIDACKAACRDRDSVFHMAAIASVMSSVDDPALTHDVTLGGTLNMLLAARDQKVQRFVFSSSAAIYGNAESAPTGEEQPYSPQSPYATAKASGEFYCRNFHDLYGLETVILRYFNVFGPRQNVNSGYAAVIPCFVNAVASGTTPIIYGDGLQTRDFVYVDNVVQANIRAATVPNVAGSTYNVAGGEGITLLRLLEEISHLTGRPTTPEFRPGRPGEVRHSRADITRARKELRFEPALLLREGLKHTLDAVWAQNDNPQEQENEKEVLSSKG